MMPRYYPPVSDQDNYRICSLLFYQFVHKHVCLCALYFIDYRKTFDSVNVYNVCKPYYYIIPNLYKLKNIAVQE